MAKNIIAIFRSSNKGLLITDASDRGKARGEVKGGLGIDGGAGKAFLWLLWRDELADLQPPYAHFCIKGDADHTLCEMLVKP